MWMLQGQYPCQNVTNRVGPLLYTCIDSWYSFHMPTMFKTFGPLLTAVNALSVKYEEITNLNVF